MSPEKAHRKHLLDKHLANTASPQEIRELLLLIEANRNDEEWEQLLLPIFYENKKDPAYDQEEWETVIKRVLNSSAPVSKLSRLYTLRKNWYRYAAAILIFAGVAGSGYLISRQMQPTLTDQTKVSKVDLDIAPGTNKAQLTLADGSVILLDSTGNGNFANQGGTKIIKLNDGQLAYEESRLESTNNTSKDSFASSSLVHYNTLSTPKGGQYQVVLPDGSRVWLNAASSLKFPTAFKGKSRKVEITGEAYLEIAPNSKQAFTVKANGTEIQVLGTSFNVNAYVDEPTITTTLLEGSIKVIIPSSHSLLKPGQQARLNLNTSTLNIVNKVNTNEVIAWKNGMFSLENKTIEEVMRQISRWYDIEISYQGQIPEINFWGEMHRDAKLSTILEFFRKSGLNFRMDQNTKTLTIINHP